MKKQFYSFKKKKIGERKTRTTILYSIFIQLLSKSALKQSVDGVSTSGADCFYFPIHGKLEDLMFLDVFSADTTGVFLISRFDVSRRAASLISGYCFPCLFFISLHKDVFTSIFTFHHIDSPSFFLNIIVVFVPFLTNDHHWGF